MEKGLVGRFAQLPDLGVERIAVVKLMGGVWMAGFKTVPGKEDVNVWVAVEELKVFPETFI